MKRRVSLLSGAFVAVMSFSGCSIFQSSGPHATPDEIEMIKRGLGDYDAMVKAAESCVVDPSDGISEVEAYKIANDYLKETGKLRDQVAFRPVESKESWLIRYPLHFVGQPDIYFDISKKDGSIRERQAEPGATDNPDDAQRVREDH